MPVKEVFTRLRAGMPYPPGLRIWNPVFTVLCAAIDIGSNTTRLLVAEPSEGQLRKVMEQRAYTRIGKDASKKGKITAEKIAEVADVVATKQRLAEEMGAETVKTVATAAIREAKNRNKVV